MYFFGPDILVAPISEPASAPGGLARNIIYFPHRADGGAWIEWGTWQAHIGPAPEGAFYERHYALDEVPLFSPAGAVIALRTLPDQDAQAAEGAGHTDVVGTAGEVPAALTVWVFPPGPGRLGGTDAPGGEEDTSVRFSSVGRIYDDDGRTLAYSPRAADQALWTDVVCEWRRAVGVPHPEAPGGAAERARDLGFDLSVRDVVSCTIQPPVGHPFEAFPAERTYTFRFLATFPPESVVVAQNYDDNQQPAAWHNAEGPDIWGDGARFPPRTNAWSYDGAQACTWVHLGFPSNPSNPVHVTLTFAPGALADDPVLTSAVARKVARAQQAKREMGRSSWYAFPVDIPRVLGVANLAARTEELLDSHNIAGGATSESTALLRSLYQQLHFDIEAGLAEVDELERRLEGLREGGGPEGEAAGKTVAAMRSLLRNAIS